jgi:hypothetical protein
MTLFKLARSASVRGISQHRSLANAKLAKFELVEGGMFGYKIYVWNKEANKWSKWE